MKVKTFKYLVIAEVILCLILIGSGLNSGSILSFPLVILGNLLRKLSLSSVFGNILAVIVYVLISVIPLFILYLLIKKKDSTKTDYLLVLISGLTFVFLYFLINPALLKYPGRDIAVNCCWISLIIVWLVLRLIRKLDNVKNNKLFEFARNILIIYTFFLTAEILLSDTASFSLNDGYPLINFISLIIALLPCLLVVFSLSFPAVELFDELKKDMWSKEASALADKLYKRCKILLIVIVVLILTGNFIQLAGMSLIDEVSVNVYIPFDIIFFILTALLFSGFIKSGNKLQEENDSFI